MTLTVSKLKLCVRITGVTLKCNKETRTPQIRSLFTSDIFKDSSYAELLRKRTLSKLAEGDSMETDVQKQFRIIIPAHISIKELKYVIAIQFRKLYPEEDPLQVRYIREDEVECDLDDDFIVSDFFLQDNFVNAVCENTLARAPLGEQEAREIAMPRPYLTPMSTMGDILHKELCPSPVVIEEHISEVQRAKELTMPNVEPKEKRCKVKVKESVQEATKEKKLKKAKKLITTEEIFTKEAESAVSKLAIESPLPSSTLDNNRFEETPVDSQVSRIFDKQEIQLPVIIQSSPVIEVFKSPAKAAAPAEASYAKITHTPPVEKSLASLIEADPHSSASSSSSGDDDDGAIPVVESKFIAPIPKPPNLLNPHAASPSFLSPSSDDEEASNVVTIPNVHRTSLTALTEELRRSNGASPIPPIPTKILAPGVGNRNNDRQRRRRNRKKDQTDSPKK